MIKFNAILLICVSSIISNTYVLYLNSKYENFYKEIPSYISYNAVVISEKTEKEYKYQYIIKIKDGIYKNKKFILNIKKENNIYLEYGDLIRFKGECLVLSESRNYKGFNYREYLKAKKIYGTIKADNVSIIKKRQNNIFIIINNIRDSIKDKCKKILPEKTSNLLIGILLGDKNEISEEIIEDFRTSNLLHILSVSGAHTSYIILGISYILNKSKISKKSVYLIIIIILILFMGITNFTPSVIRACIMGILLIGSNLFYCKPDIITSISISLLASLIINPFSINDIGLQLSYLGTIGIIMFSANYQIIFEKIKISKKISKLLSVTFGAQTMIMPMTALKLNSISFTFFISNLIVSPILGFIMIFRDHNNFYIIYIK